MVARSEDPKTSHPEIIQGGMGVGISGWRLAGTVAAAGQLGVVSGTALEVVYARILQSGDLEGHVRRAFARFPVPEVAEAALARYFVPGGVEPGTPLRAVPMYTVAPRADLLGLSALTNFSEVWLAKELGRGGKVGINYLYKIQLPLLASLYGAMLAGVDYVIIGAGNPSEVPEAMTRLARGMQARLRMTVQYADPRVERWVELEPRALMKERLSTTPRPRFLAIVSAADQAEAMLEGPREPPDGFVVEAPTAGGHNAPPRGPRQLNEAGEPRYGPRDRVDTAALGRLGRPFWLAGSYGSPAGLRRARASGAAGVQVGTAFAFTRESGLAPDLRQAVLDAARAGRARTFTDPRASPTGFPFKVVPLQGTLTDPEVYAERRRICDLGFLRVPFASPSGKIGYRCPAEPERAYAAKRGRPEHVGGRKCLCNALLSNLGLGQARASGRTEPPLVTAGDDVARVDEYLPLGATSYGAKDVIDRLLAPAAPGS